MAERAEGPPAGIDEDRVELAPLPLDLVVQAVKIGRLGRLCFHGGPTATDLAGCSVQSRLSAAGEVNGGALCNEALGRSQADATGTARNKRNFVFEFLAHDVLLWSDAPRTAGPAKRDHHNAGEHFVDKSVDNEYIVH